MKLLVLFVSCWLLCGPVLSQTTYVWTAASGNWGVAANWSPARNTPAASDILVFRGNTQAAPTVNAVPTQVVGSIRVINNCSPNFQSTGTTTLTIGNAGIAAPHLYIEAGSTLTINGSGINTITFSIASGYTAEIFGNLVFKGAGHRLTGVNAGSVFFKNGSGFTAGTGFSGNPFGNTTADMIHFEAGSYFYSEAGGNPFGLTAPASAVIFEKGSWYTHRQSGIPALSGRTYANFEVDDPSSWTATGSQPFRCDTLQVTNTGTTTLSMSGGVVISGNLTVVNGGLSFVTGAGVIQTVLFDGTVPQTISGNIFLNIATQVAIAAGATVDLQTSINSPDTITMYGTLNTNSYQVASAKFFMHPYLSPGALTGNVTGNSNKITNCAQALTLLRGMRIAGPGIPANTFILRTYGTTIEMSRFATSTSINASLSTSTVDKSILGIGSTYGITADPSGFGNIISGQRNYAPDGIYEYNAPVPQVTGNGLPSAITGTLRINNTAGISSLGVTLSRPTAINGFLDLLAGKIRTTSTNLLTIAQSGAISHYSNESFVGGPLQVIGHSGFTFPIGINAPVAPTGSIYAPVVMNSVSGVSTSSDTYTAEYFRANPQNISANVENPIDHISFLEYWRIDRDDAGSNSPEKTIVLEVNPESFCYNLSTMLVASYDGSTNSWKSMGHSGQYLDPASLATTFQWGKVFSEPLTKISGYFTLATTDAFIDNPLPVQLIAFNAARTASTRAKLTWQLATSCTPATTFEIQKAVAGRQFTTIGRVQGIYGDLDYEYFDNDLRDGITYYRLKIVEGSNIDFSRTISLGSANAGVVLASVNPSLVQQKTNVVIVTDRPQAIVLSITDMQGRVLMQQKTPVASGTTQVPVDVSSLPAGVYQVSVITGYGRLNTLRFIKQ